MKPLTAVSTELVRHVGDRAELERQLCFVGSARTDFGGNVHFRPQADIKECAPLLVSNCAE